MNDVTKVGGSVFLLVDLEMFSCLIEMGKLWFSKIQGMLCWQITPLLWFLCKYRLFNKANEILFIFISN